MPLMPRFHFLNVESNVNCYEQVFSDLSWPCPVKASVAFIYIAISANQVAWQENLQYQIWNIRSQEQGIEVEFVLIAVWELRE